MSTSYNNKYTTQNTFPDDQLPATASAQSWYDMMIRQQQHESLVEKLFLHEQQQRLQHRLLLRDDDLDDRCSSEETFPIDFRQHKWPITTSRYLQAHAVQDDPQPCSPLDLSVKGQNHAKTTTLLQVTATVNHRQEEYFDKGSTTPVKHSLPDSNAVSIESKCKSKKSKQHSPVLKINNNNNNNVDEHNDGKLLKKLKAASRKLNFSQKAGRLDKSSPVSGTIIIEKPTDLGDSEKSERSENRKRPWQDDNKTSENAFDKRDDLSEEYRVRDVGNEDDDEFSGDIDPKYNVVAVTNEARSLLAEIPNVIGEYRCKLCGTVYDDAFALAAHRCKCIVHVRYRCPECSKVFQCPANLASHRRWHGATTGKLAAGSIETKKLHHDASKERNDLQTIDDSVERPAQSPAFSTTSATSTGSSGSIPTTVNNVFFKKNMLQRAAIEANNNIYKTTDNNMVK
ncbi:uncharacterized protein LOC126897257 [Daktulosphaira vitifoliae]|uniref:uncharacterized protein LOC126897257 n=1 Tax=Daktulosphaira vitifoliae TaxID=58002 RepID=UPI0021A9938B|nr:uncharacterized protein LOC126897257 [Daktulosphaira vitifoliae]